MLEFQSASAVSSLPFSRAKVGRSNFILDGALNWGTASDALSPQEMKFEGLTSATTTRHLRCRCETSELETALAPNDWRAAHRPSSGFTVLAPTGPARLLKYQHESGEGHFENRCRS
jgi:hypothetical protein